MDKQDKIFRIADKITKFNFEEIWNIEGSAMETLKKSEIAEEMFFKGIAYIIDHLANLKQIDLEKIEKKLSNI